MYGLVVNLTLVHHRHLYTCSLVHFLDGIRHRIGFRLIIISVILPLPLGLSMILFVRLMQLLLVKQFWSTEMKNAFCITDMSCFVVMCKMIGGCNGFIMESTSCAPFLSPVNLLAKVVSLQGLKFRMDVPLFKLWPCVVASNLLPWHWKTLTSLDCTPTKLSLKASFCGQVMWWNGEWHMTWQNLRLPIAIGGLQSWFDMILNHMMSNVTPMGLEMLYLGVMTCIGLIIRLSLHRCLNWRLICLRSMETLTSCHWQKEERAWNLSVMFCWCVALEKIKD